MFYENEVVMLVFGFLVTVFIGLKYEQLKNIKSYKILLSGFFTLFAAWIFSTLEEFYFEQLLNLFEHLLYTSSSVFLFIWIYKTLIVKPKVK
ncbi:MAG: hypothetical protein P8Y99_08740 [Calditrichaceae bacterium]